jgi:hypothetical protein
LEFFEVELFDVADSPLRTLTVDRLVWRRANEQAAGRSRRLTSANSASDSHVLNCLETNNDIEGDVRIGAAVTEPEQTGGCRERIYQACRMTFSSMSTPTTSRSRSQHVGSISFAEMDQNARFDERCSRRTGEMFVCERGSLIHGRKFTGPFNIYQP